MVNVYDMPRLGAPQARNLGASKSSGDILVFADAHLEFKQGWGPRFTNALDLNRRSIIAPCITVIGNENCRGCGFKWSDLSMQVFWLPDLMSQIHEIPFACGCCMVMEKEVFDEIGQFDTGIRFWGEEDSELCMRAWLMGFRVLCEPPVRVGHKFRASFPYNLDRIDIIFNKIRFVISHLSSERVTKYLRTIADAQDFSKLLLMVLEGNTLDRRLDMFSKRVHTDDWFFEEFPMNDWTR
jgi:GT2 family glycosyltransferase